MSYPRKSTTILAANDYCKEEDWDAMVDAANGMNIAAGVTIQYPYSFIVRNVGGVYDAISGNGALTYGGSSDAGGIDGDDAAAVIQACVTALALTGGIIFIRKGTYNIGSTITVPSDGISFFGEGAYCNSGTILHLTADVDMFYLFSTVGKPIGNRFSNLNLQGNWASGRAAGSGINSGGSGYTVIDHCEIYNFPTAGIMTTWVGAVQGHSGGWFIHHNEIINNNVGLNLFQLLDSEISFNQIGSVVTSNWAQMLVEQGMHMIQGNHFWTQEDAAETCIYLYGNTGDVSIIGNMFEGAETVGTASIKGWCDTGTSVARLVIANNIFQDQGTLARVSYAVFLEATDAQSYKNVIVSNNIFGETCVNAMAAVKTLNLVFTGNIVHGDLSFDPATIINKEIKNNVGIVTRITGCVQIANGGTITHGLTYNGVAVIPTKKIISSEEELIFARIGTFDATTVTVNLVQWDAGTTAFVYPAGTHWVNYDLEYSV
jgi:hypothetical protein